jgi:hypothetical protein
VKQTSTVLNYLVALFFLFSKKHQFNKVKLKSENTSFEDRMLQETLEETTFE